MECLQSEEQIYYLLTINNNTENSLKLFVDLKHLVSKSFESTTELNKI